MKNYFGIFTLSILLAALKAEQLDTVHITPEFKERYVKVGDSLKVPCHVITDGNSGDQKLKWTKPTSVGSSEHSGTVSLANEKVRKYSDLTIASMTDSLFGTYTCSYGSSSVSFELKVAPEEVSQANYTYENKDPVTISCKMVGMDSDRIEKVEWLKNDTLVSELSEKKRFKEDSENHTLTISEPTRDDADQYYARYTFKDMESPYDCGVMFAAEPLVLDFDKSKNLIEDDNMELQCKVKGFPRAEVQWLKNGKLLNGSDSKRVIQSPLDGYKNARLVIKSVQFDDAGDYTCKAFSAYFNSSHSKTLVVRVKDKLAALWPFLGIVGEVVILCAIIFIYERRRVKQAEKEANNAEDVDGSSLKKEGVRHRGQKK